MNVLIVEDEALVGLELAAALERGGFHVLGPAASGNEALSLARGNIPWLALIVIHLVVGDMDGVELARALRDAYGTTCIYATVSPEQARAGRDAAVGFIEKPCDPGVVVRVVQALAASGKGQELASPPVGLAWFV